MTNSTTRVSSLRSIIHTFGYADDAALIDHGDERGITRSTNPVTSIASGSRMDADITEISISKTKVLHVCEQDKVSATTDGEARSACKFTCPHTNCGFEFKTKLGMQIHADNTNGRIIMRSTKSWMMMALPMSNGTWLGYTAKYLGTIFAADGLQVYDIKQRIAKAMSSHPKKSP